MIWTEVTDLGADAVTFSHHYEFPDGGKLQSDASLRFRSDQQIRASLTGAGFAIKDVHGGWRGQALGHGEGEMIFIAQREP